MGLETETKSRDSITGIVTIKNFLELEPDLKKVWIRANYSLMLYFVPGIFLSVLLSSEVCMDWILDLFDPDFCLLQQDQEQR